ncbi:MAG: AmmeMemoRadiSam system radical SAM enzyme [Chlorobi bacterium]|nr:AmmeMemoRadiSam system radical SAM enzyme [Chlorobiota bacterium]
MHEAEYYTVPGNQYVQCNLCPANCRLKPGQTGTCHVRRNINGKLYALTYGLIAALHTDPIEKKPLYHYYPGKVVLSAGTAGCNLHCTFCQNWDISQRSPDELPVQHLSPEELIEQARTVPGNLGIAYTYNEPAIWFEYVRDTAILAHRYGLKNILVSNGYINEAPLQELLPLIDAINIDLKAFDDHFYRKYTGAKFQPVLNTLQWLKKFRIHTEITILVIPGLNDDPDRFGKMCSWISDKLGHETVLHISRYYPAWKMKIPPTPPETLKELYRIAKNILDYVYVGNIELPEGHDTTCPKCGKIVIHRSGYYTDTTGLDEKGNCADCHHHIFDYL